MRLFSLAFLLFFIKSSTLLADDSFTGVEYVRNYDGDTIVVNLNGVVPIFGFNIPIRLAGIDTAELNSTDLCEQTSAKKSRDLIEALLIFSQSIDLKEVQRDKYFRLVAKVYVDGLDLSALLLEKGLAVPYKGGAKQKINWCELTK